MKPGKGTMEGIMVGETNQQGNDPGASKIHSTIFKLVIANALYPQSVNYIILI